MSIEELLASLNISYPGRYNGDSYVIVIPGSDNYDILASKLEKSSLLIEDEDRGGIFNDIAHTWYFCGDDYDLDLKANFVDDEYTLTIMPS